MTAFIETAHELTQLLLEGFREEGANLSESEVSILYSGGLDSAVISMLARRTLKRKNTSLLTFGVEGSRDLLHARQGVDFIDLEWNGHVLSEEAILEGAKDLLGLIPDLSFLELSYELPLYFGVKHSGGEVIITGQGADELFGGYARYKKAKDPLELRLMLDRDRVKLFTRTKKVERAIAYHFGKTLITPYMFENIITFSGSLGIEELIGMDGTNKRVLRESARILGLPEIICSRSKLAAQYGSGISKVLKKQRKNGLLSLS